MADEFQGGTSAGGVTGDVTGLELAEVYQQSYVHVTGHNRVWGCESNGIKGVYRSSKHRVEGNQTVLNNY